MKVKQVYANTIVPVNAASLSIMVECVEFLMTTLPEEPNAKEWRMMHKALQHGRLQLRNAGVLEQADE